MQTIRFPRLALALLILAIAPCGRLAAQGFPLDLVVEDVEAFPDTEFNLIVRTVQDAPLSAIAFAIESRERRGEPIPALGSLVSATAFSAASDAVVTANLDSAAQRLEVSVSSPSGTLNAEYGPLVVVRLAMAPGLVDRQRFELRMDPDVIALAADGAPLTTLAGRGRLRITVPEPGAGLSGLGGETFPGADVVLGPATVQPFAIGGGTIELVYDPAFAAGPATVKIDPRYGSGQIDALTELEPGRLLIDFSSPAGDLNADLHGLFLSASVPSLPNLEPPLTFPFALGPATALYDPDGVPIPLETEADATTFLVPELLFADGLEGADLLGFWNFVAD